MVPIIKDKNEDIKNNIFIKLVGNPTPASGSAVPPNTASLPIVQFPEGTDAITASRFTVLIISKDRMIIAILGIILNQVVTIVGTSL